MSDFYFAVGDALPKITAALKNPDGSVPNLATATSISFILKLNTVKTYTATIVNALTGTVEATLSAADISAAGAGIYKAKFLVNWSGNKLSFPNRKWLYGEVTADLT